MIYDIDPQTKQNLAKLANKCSNEDRTMYRDKRTGNCRMSNNRHFTCTYLKEPPEIEKEYSIVTTRPCGKPLKTS